MCTLIQSAPSIHDPYGFVFIGHPMKKANGLSYQIVKQQWIPVAVVERTMFGIFRGHGIDGGLSRGEGVVGERLRSGLRSSRVGDEDEHGLMVADGLFSNEGNGPELIVLVPDFPHVIRLRVFGILFEEILDIHDKRIREKGVKGRIGAKRKGKSSVLFP